MALSQLCPNRTESLGKASGRATRFRMGRQPSFPTHNSIRHMGLVASMHARAVSLNGRPEQGMWRCGCIHGPGSLAEHGIDIKARKDFFKAKVLRLCCLTTSVRQCLHGCMRISRAVRTVPLCSWQTTHHELLAVCSCFGRCSSAPLLLCGCAAERGEI